MKLESLYQELILQHYRRPRNRGDLDPANVRIVMNNPVCGDEITLQLRLEDDRIGAVKFLGQGCAISQASASMMTQQLTGKSMDEARRIAARFTEMLHGDAAAARDAQLGDLRALAGVSRFPVRIKCALLAWNAFDEADRALSAPPPPG